MNYKSITFVSVLSLLFIGVFFSGVRDAQAFDQTFPINIYSSEPGKSLGGGIGWQGMSNFHVTVSHTVLAYKNGNLLENGGTINTGDVLSFTVPTHDSDIFWEGTGYNNDSPYGYWNSLASILDASQLDRIVNNMCNKLDVGLSVNPQTYTFDHSQSTAGLNCNSSGSSCTVTSAGTISTKVTFSSTYGKFYANWVAGDCLGGSSTGPVNGCFVAGTKVSLGNGKYKNIENIRQGEVVKSSQGTAKVLNMMVIPFKGYIYAFNGDGNYFVTATHPFMTERGWKSFDPEGTRKEVPGLKVSLLNIGDVFLMENGKKVLLYKIDKKYTETTVYNFHTNNTHDYYSNGYLVHNTKINPQEY